MYRDYFDQIVQVIYWWTLACVALSFRFSPIVPTEPCHHKSHVKLFQSYFNCDFYCSCYVIGSENVPNFKSNGASLLVYGHPGVRSPLWLPKPDPLHWIPRKLLQCHLKRSKRTLPTTDEYTVKSLIICCTNRSIQQLQMAWSQVGSRPSEATELTISRFSHCIFIGCRHDQLQIWFSIFGALLSGILRYCSRNLPYNGHGLHHQLLLAHSSCLACAKKKLRFTVQYRKLLL